jgi:hypothetical protein
MRLLGTQPPATELKAEETSLIKQLPAKRVLADKVIDQTGKNGPWFDGRVLFISNSEVIEVPTRCRATTVYGAASRMPRAAKPGIPKKMRKGNDKRIHTVLVEIIERKKK